ncbi:HEAT repeat domain-containing protein [Streptomyces sp. NPDC079020]|uniref:HEAT repeat domain-containing protein n=1 Tax=Streptomyces sp. NPDC079020 TaxID=3365722 RepID=UPI0037D43DA7
MRDDPSPQVRVSAAESLINLDRHTHTAVSYLDRTLARHPDVRVRLQAINALTFIDRDIARRALPAVEAAAVSEDEYLHHAGRYPKLVLDGTYTPSSGLYEPVS